ncbi:MAG: OmpP1/FadL family transporter [Syntrophaceae bacterium]
MKKLWTSVLCFLVMAVVFVCGPAWAGGIMLYQFGSPDVGYASAGYAARAQDASTVFTNPAGMSRLESSQFLGGMQALYSDLKFNPNSDTKVPGGGNDGGVAIGWSPGGSLFVVQKLNQDLSLGFGVLSYFGLSQQFDDNWVGRYYVQKSTLVGMTLTPAVSYKVYDWLYLGAGLNLMYGYLSDQAAINNMTNTLPDGQLKYKDDTWGYGANLGILLEPQKGTRFGLTYLSEVKLEFSDVPEFSGLGPGLRTALAAKGLLSSSLDLKLTVPQMLMFSAYHELNSKWAIMGNLGWQDWSRFGKADVGINTDNPTTLTVDSHYKDTWHFALATQYTYSPAWKFSFGIAYDSSAVTDENRTVSVPMGEIKSFAFGAQYALSPSLTLGASYQFAWLGDMPVDQERGPLAGRVAGEFSNTTFSFFALNLKWTY